MQENRRRYRELFYTADIGDSISGAILFKETLYQAASDGTPFVDCLNRLGVFPGIKVDEVNRGGVESVSRAWLLRTLRLRFTSYLVSHMSEYSHLHFGLPGERFATAHSTFIAALDATNATNMAGMRKCMCWPRCYAGPGPLRRSGRDQHTRA